MKVHLDVWRDIVFVDEIIYLVRKYASVLAVQRLKN